MGVFFKNKSVYDPMHKEKTASGGPAGGQPFEKFDKQVLSNPFQAPPKYF
ncbi:hypothetical protein [Desulfoluna spongiiphila]|nr:hypothetical protein [Desulfoluna spongiiphila]VVS93012.1 consensus disorder prediction [Desulfoluna spongiiphila]